MNRPMKAVLLHLGSNMWNKKGQGGYGEKLVCEKDVWIKVTNVMVELGYNTLLIDMGEGVELKRHPELAVEGTWSQAEFRTELKRLRDMGITPYPKFNFSLGHSAWLQEYNYMPDAPEYYAVCRDVIEETIELFDTPELFHLGLEEEDYEMQKNYTVAVARTPEKKLADALFLFDIVRSKGVRPWMWVDPVSMDSFGGIDIFCEKVGKDVLMSNYQYSELTARELAEGTEHLWFKFYRILGECGYEQIPTVSIWGWHLNSKETMKYCKRYVSGVSGYMMAPWMRTNQNDYLALMTCLTNFNYAWEDEMK